MNEAQKRILIIEDDQFLREFYEELLQAEGFSVDSASDGETGLNMLKGGGYNLILLDIMLPKKDGLQILKEIKSSPPEKPNGPIVVLTNLGQDSIIRTCYELGAAGYMIKSALNPDQVLVELYNYLKQSA